MHRSKRLLLLSAAAAVFAAALPAHAQNALDNILKAKEIKIAIPTDFPPYGSVGPDLKPQGLDIEMANYIAGKLGVKVELLPALMLAGANCAVAPVGRPLTVSVIALAVPAVTVDEIVVVPLAPGSTATTAGLASIEKSLSATLSSQKPRP